MTDFVALVFDNACGRSSVCHVFFGRPLTRLTLKVFAAAEVQTALWFAHHMLEAAYVPGFSLSKYIACPCVHDLDVHYFTRSWLCRVLCL